MLVWPAPGYGEGPHSIAIWRELPPAGPIYSYDVMISFPCPCGTHAFSLPDDEAGGLVQCPNCKRLNDVPSLSDLQNMDADGTVRLTAPKRRDDPNRLAELHRAYGRSRTDDEGNEIDLRSSFDELRKVGEKPEEGKKRREPPRYDPMTGELIREIDVAPVKPRQVISMAQVAAPAMAPIETDPRKLSYSRRHSARVAKADAEIPSLASLPFRLFEPLNILVMFFITVLFVFFCSLAIPVIGGFFVISPVPVVVMALLMSHYSNCVQDLGPGAENELPTPMRYVSLFDDIWWPFCWTFFSLMLCFGPAVMTVLYVPRPVALPAAGVMAVVGVAFFPGVFLTLSASGHVGNLRPDRLLAFIGMLGAAYAPAIFLSAVTLIANLLAVSMFAFTFLAGLTASRVSHFVGFGAVSLVISVVAIYMGHLTAWWLAVLFRRHEDHVPWHFEEHERDRAEGKRLKALAELERSRNRRFAGV